MYHIKSYCMLATSKCRKHGNARLRLSIRLTLLILLMPHRVLELGFALRQSDVSDW